VYLDLCRHGRHAYRRGGRSHNEPDRFRAGVLLPNGVFDADGKTDFAVWRTLTATWYVVNSSNGSVTARQWGLAFAPHNDVLVAADYDGDGKTHLAV